MQIYKTWEEYLNSAQEYYLDENNPADEDTNISCGRYDVFGKSDIDTYYIMRDERLVAIIVGSVDDAVAYANSEFFYDSAYGNGDAYDFLIENADSLDLDDETLAAAKAYMCFDWSFLADEYAEIADTLGLGFLRDEESGEYEDNPLDTAEAFAAIDKHRSEIVAVYCKFLERNNDD